MILRLIKLQKESIDWVLGDIIIVSQFIFPRWAAEISTSRERVTKANTN